jgi:hypothetical protein
MGLLAHDTLFRDGLSERHAGAPMHVEGGPRGQLLSPAR